MSEPEPSPGCVEIPADRLNWIQLLKKIYEFEADRVAGAGSFRRDISEVLWSASEIRSKLNLDDEEERAFDELLRYMLDKRQAMRVPAHDGLLERYLTRVAELIRILGHTPEYWHRGRPGVGAIRWLVEEKKVPARTIPVAEFLARLQTIISDSIGRGDETLNLRKASELVVKGVAKSLARGDWEKARFSVFQFDATREMILSQFKPRYSPSVQILTAGVGSGKTVGFSLAALISAVEGILGGEESRRCHLLVYPRKALASNQFTVLSEFQRRIGLPALDVHFEHASYYTGRLRKRSVKQGIDETYGRPGPPPDIIITTFETLKRRLQHPLFARKMSKYLARVVLDEVHLAEGLSGAHIAMLMSRLSSIAADRRPCWTASSATVAAPDEHAARIFNVQPRDVATVFPSEDAMSTVGLVHHVFLRPSGRVSNLGLLVNATSLLTHIRRDDAGIRGTDDRKRQKTIGFADNLDLLGRWNADLRENERTEATQERQHPRGPDPLQWDERQREVPYALRFYKPLEKRIESEGGRPEALEAVLMEYRGKSLCTRCMKGELVRIGEVAAPTLQSLSKIVYRNPHKKDDHAVRTFRIESDVFREQKAVIGTLDLCPYLRAGACIWFPRGSDEVAEEIPRASGVYEWKSVVRSAVHSSKKDVEPELEEDLAEIVFNEPARRVYDVGDDKRIPIDIVLASPSLEVGVDLPMVTESIMTNAIRNVSTYRQKVGRIGREDGLDVVNVTLVTDSPVDLHYYRQPRKLVSLGRLDPIPMKDRNEAIVQSAVYMAVWDWLAVHVDLPEVMPDGINRDGTTEFSAALGRCLARLSESRSELQGYLSEVSRRTFRPDSPTIASAIDQAEQEIAILLRDASGTFEATPSSDSLTVADLLVYARLGPRGRTVRPRAERRLLDRFYRLVDESSSASSRIVAMAALAEVMKDLALMTRTGDWREDLLRNSGTRLAQLLSAGVSDDSEYDVRDIAMRILPQLADSLVELRRAGHDPLVFTLNQQYGDLLKQTVWKGHYLSTIMQVLSAFESVRRERTNARPENLYSSPNEPQTRLEGAPVGHTHVPVGEAMFGFLPGMWTYRFPYGCYKVKVGLLDAEPSGRIIAALDGMIQAGNRFELIDRGLPAPPGLPGTVDVYTPLQLSLQRVWHKYVPVDWGRGLVLDRDEARAREDGGQNRDRGRLVKIPRGYLNRWVEVRASDGRLLGPYLPDEGEFHIDDEPGPLDGNAVATRVRHPLFRSLLDRAEWHDTLDITDYVYAISRSYSRAGGEEVELAYRDAFGHIGIGTRYETEGMSIRLNQATVESVVAKVSKSLLEGATEWAPSLIKAFRAYLAYLCTQSGTTANPFFLDDFSAIILTLVGVRREPLTLDDLIAGFVTLKTDREKLTSEAEALYRARLLRTTADPETVGAETRPTDEQEIIDRVNRLSRAVEAMPDSPPEEKPMEFLKRWVRWTLLNTFGVVALTSLQQFSGATESDVGYSIDPTAWDGRNPRVYLYDRAYNGNGSCSVAATYLHIPNLIRHRDVRRSRFLPTDDFLSTLEERLLQCPQFHTDICALSMISQGGPDSVGIPGLRDIREQAAEVLEVSNSVWQRLGIRGPADAPRLPLVRTAHERIGADLNLDPDDLLRATSICWNGCPECVERPYLASGGRVGRYYLDKAVLDAWFREGILSTEEYEVLDFASLGAGRSRPGIGLLHRLRLDLPNRRVRSVQLPWTIGFDVSRGDATPNARLLLRVSDVLDLRLGETEASGVAAGVESVGFKRLLWFDLVLTAYLDVLGLLDEARKDVMLVYYDLRDVSFDDVGLSARMVDAVLTEARKSGMVHGLKSLSDMLIWLLLRGFRVSVCVDGHRIDDEIVRKFMSRLVQLGAKAKTKKMQRGLMHKKALVTPVGVLSGSANLTEGGTGTNEEILNHFFYGTSGYQQLKANVEDTFHGASSWRT